MPMRDQPSHDWAARRRSRWSVSRIAAAVLLHLLVLAALVLGTDRVRMPRPGTERTTVLVTVALVRPKPPPIAPPKAHPPEPRDGATKDGRPRRDEPDTAAPREPVSEPITLPMHEPQPAVAIAAKPSASAPSAPLVDILNTAATRAAIRDAARGTRLSELGNAATHEDQGSAMPMDDGSVCETCTRDLAPSKRASERLSQGVASAARPDCLKLSSAAGLLALPVLAYAEAAGKCGN